MRWLGKNNSLEGLRRRWINKTISFETPQSATAGSDVAGNGASGKRLEASGSVWEASRRLREHLESLRKALGAKALGALARQK